MSTINTEILKIKGNWQEVANDCRTTVGKEELGREPSEEFKSKILIAEHAPIRSISVKWRWAGIKSWVATHWVRHKWECFVRSQRSDRTGIPRDELPQNAPVDFVGEANTQALIDTWRKRLCFQASPETRKYAESLKCEICDIEPNISDVLVPNCVYRFGCPEMKSCGFWERFIEWCAGYNGVSIEALANMSISKRYMYYNKYFCTHREEQNK